MHSMKVDGQDVEEVYEAAQRGARARARRPGPGLPRRRDLPAHRPLRRRPAGLPLQGGARESCARRRIRSSKLREQLELSDEEWEALDREVGEIVEASVEFAKNGTDPKPEDALKNVYA